MLMHGGADRIDGADPGHVPVPTSLLALDFGGVGRGIPTAGVPVGIPLGAQITGVTGAIGTAAEIQH